MKPRRRPQVLFVVTNGDYSGVGRWLVDACAYFSPKMGVNVLFWCRAGPLVNALDKLPDVRYSCAEAKRGRDLRASARVYRYISRLKPDILHLCEQPSGILPVLGALRAPFTCELHVYPKGRIDRLIRSLAFWGCRLLIVPSEQVASYVRANLVAPFTPIVVLPNATTQPDCVRIASPIHRTLVLPTRLVPRKGLHLLKPLLALASSEQLPLSIRVVGDGPLRSHLTDELRTYIASGRVTFDGWIEEVDDIYRGADGLLVLSEEETFGRTPIEAIARGLPIVGIEPPALMPHLATIRSFVSRDHDLHKLIASVRSFSRETLSSTDHQMMHALWEQRYSTNEVLPRLYATITLGTRTAFTQEQVN